MKICPLCNVEVEHLKKHMKKMHPQDYTLRYDQSVIRNHICPVVYLQNFAHLSENYLNKNFNFKTYRPPTRKDYLIYAHDKIKNGDIYATSLENIGVKKGIYSKKVEKYLEKIEASVSIEFKEIRRIRDALFINPYHIFRFMMAQIVRTPKFRKKLEIDLKFLQNMSEEEFSQSIMRLYLVKKPKELIEKDLRKLHEDMILYNTFERIFKWSKMTLITNHTEIPFITSETPVVYNNIEFFPSYLSSEDRFEYSPLLSRDYAIIYMPLDPRFSITINQFDNTQSDMLIDYEDVIEEDKIMLLNSIIYMYADRLILMKESDLGLIRKVRDQCGSIIDKEFQTLEFSYNQLKKIINNNQ